MTTKSSEIDFDSYRDNEEKFNIEIKEDGSWWHNGSQITRKALIKLFNSILHFNSKDNEYWLYVPVQHGEKGRIKVADVPYVIHDYFFRDDILVLKTNLDEEVELKGDISFIQRDFHRATDPIPYIEVRDGLLARLGQSVFYNLLNEVAEEKADGMYVSSNGKQYLLAALNA